MKRKNRGGVHKSWIIMGLAGVVLVSAGLAYGLRMNRLVVGIPEDSGPEFYQWLTTALPEGHLLSPQTRGILDSLRVWNGPDLIFGELNRGEIVNKLFPQPRRPGDPVLLGFDPYVLVYNRGANLIAPVAGDFAAPGRRLTLAGADDGELTAFLVFILGLTAGPRAVDGLSNLPKAGMDLGDPGVAAVVQLLQDLKGWGILEPAWFDQDLNALRETLAAGRLVDMAFCSYAIRKALNPIQAFDYRTVPLPSGGGRLPYPVRSLGVRIVPGSPAARRAEASLGILSVPDQLQSFGEKTAYLSFSPSGPFLNRDHRELLAALYGADPFPIGPELRALPGWDTWLMTLRTYLRAQ